MLATTPLDGFDWRSSDDWVQWFVGIPLRVLLIVTVGTLLLALVRRVIRRVTEHIADGVTSPRSKNLRRLGRTEVGSVLLQANPLANARRAQRSRTVGSVLRSAANILIGVTVVLMVLDQLGVNIAPFLASAGIAGVALGFGAQSLVKDFLSGTFLLLEDQYGVGDTVDFGTVTGTVEEVALRVTKVRDADGTLWYLRNGEILRTGNKTQEWARASVEVAVPYSADVEKVRRTLLAAAEELGQDPVLGTYLVATPEVSGIQSMSAESLHLTVGVRTRPAMQWDVEAGLRARVRAHLAAAGIPWAGAELVVLLDHGPAAAPEDASAGRATRSAEQPGADDTSSTSAEADPEA